MNKQKHTKQKHKNITTKTQKNKQNIKKTYELKQNHKNITKTTTKYNTREKHETNWIRTEYEVNTNWIRTEYELNFATGAPPQQKTADLLGDLPQDWDPHEDGQPGR